MKGQNGVSSAWFFLSSGSQPCLGWVGGWVGGCVCVCVVCVWGAMWRSLITLWETWKQKVWVWESLIFASSLIPGCFLLGSWLISQDHFLRTGAVHIKGVIWKYMKIYLKSWKFLKIHENVQWSEWPNWFSAAGVSFWALVVDLSLC